MPLIDAFAGPAADGVGAMPVEEGVSHWETSSMRFGENFFDVGNW